MQLHRPVLCLILIIALAAVPSASASVQTGPDSGSGYLELINPDNSTYVFDSSNMSLYNYVTNLPDGWWMFNPATPLNADSDLWVVGFIFGIVAVTIAVVALIRRNNNE